MTDRPGPEELATTRLLLRRWRDTDRELFAGMNADPEVMEYFPSTLTRGESDAFVDRVEDHFEVSGFGLWALESRSVAGVGAGRFLGFVGLWVVGFEAHFTPAVEAGWRLERAVWGRGVATEAAREVLRDGFERLDLDEIVAFTAVGNRRSRRVMEKIGMQLDPDGYFDHPNVEEGHPLRRHVLYRFDRGSWRSG